MKTEELVTVLESKFGDQITGKNLENEIFEKFGIRSENCEDLCFQIRTYFKWICFHTVHVDFFVLTVFKNCTFSYFSYVR